MPTISSGSKPASTKDRVIRVFVSSTFRDMIEDRNELKSQTWPALRRLCRGRSVEFVDVDLRWGITQEQTERKEVVRLCLAEVKRCRPYFIGLLGEHYGTVLGPEAYPPALLSEEKWLDREAFKRSVTELEILHGVLNNPDMAGRAFFYFRDPAYAQARGRAFLPDDAASDTRQKTLKQQVKTVCEEKQIPLREGYADPRDLAKQVLADLTAAIEAEFPADQVPDVWAGEDRDHAAYAKSRRTDFYVGRQGYFDRLDGHANTGDEGRGLTVLGESGGGKSALLANWMARWRQANPKDFVFQHYIGSSAMSAGHLALMRRLMVAIIRWCGDDGGRGGFGAEEERIPAKAEEIVKVFPSYLDRLAVRASQRKVKAIIVLDALNQIEDREHGRLLGWLPYRMPGEVRLIVSTPPGDTLKALEPRGWPTLTVEPLETDERIRLITNYLAHFSQGLSDARARKIADVAAAANPLYLKTLLDDLRATGAHDRLDTQIEDYLQATDISALFGKILARYEHDYERDLPGLVREALSLLWAARRGLTEPELLELLRPEGQSQLPAAVWSPLRYALEDGLVDRDGVLAFAHEHLRNAVERRYVTDQDNQDEYRLRLADLFERQMVSARSCDELPWLLWMTESCVRLRACLLDIDRFLEIHKRDENELLGYWIWLKEERIMGQPYVQAFELWAQSKDETPAVSYAANQVSLFLLEAAHHADAEPLLRRALKIDERRYGPNHPEVACCLNNLAQLLMATNRLKEAEPMMWRALAIDEQSLGQNQPGVATDLHNLAALLQATNRLAKAEPLMRRALAIKEQRYGPDHPEVAQCLILLASLLQANNRLEEAEPLMRRALAIDEQSFGKNHPSIAHDLSHLAALLEATNLLSEAEPLMWQALAIDEQSYGPDHPKVAIRLINLASLLQDTNRLAEAEPLMWRALAIDEQNFGSNHPNVAIKLNSLALLLRATNRLAEAEPLMRRALAIDEQSFGSDHPNVAIRLSNLALLLEDTNRLAQAEPLMWQALAIDEQSYGPDHSKVAKDINNLAALLQATNRLAEAEPLMRRALEIDEHSFGANHPSVAISLGNLAQLLQATNRLAEAEPLMRCALQIGEHSFGENHPKVAIRLNNLAVLLKVTNRLMEAEPLMRRALQIDEHSFGENHPDVARDLGNLAVLLRATNRLAEAEPLMRRALQIDEHSYGKNHPNVARDLNNLAGLLGDTNRLAEAEPMMRRALQIDEHSHGENHPDVARDLNNLAELLQDTNRLVEAEPLMRRALQIYERSFGENHPDVAIVLNSLAGLLKDTNRLTEAESLYHRALQIDERSFGENHPDVARDLNNLAGLLRVSDRIKEAIPLIERSLKINASSFGPDHLATAGSLSWLADAYQATNRLTKAEPLMRHALQILETSLGKEHPSVATQLNNLAMLLKDTNRLAEAESLMRRALAIDEQSLVPDHPDVARDLNNLALVLVATNRMAEAEPLMRRQLEISLKFTVSTGHQHPRLPRAIRNYACLLRDLGHSEEQIRLTMESLAQAYGMSLSGN